MASTFSGDKLVTKYLRYLNRGLRPLPLYRRREIMAEFTENLTEARADLDPSDEPGLRALLARVGLPSELAAEIVEAEDVPKRRPIDDFVPILLLLDLRHRVALAVQDLASGRQAPRDAGLAARDRGLLLGTGSRRFF